jgi:uncharacterized protein YwgA
MLFDLLGVTCMAINESKDQIMLGRTKFQKTVYFSRYLGWDIDPYSLHYYGPYSREVADSLHFAMRRKFVKEDNSESIAKYTLTEEGHKFLKEFKNEISTSQTLNKYTEKLFSELTKYTKPQLEIASTIDFVHVNSPKLPKKELIDKVADIKDNYTKKDIMDGYNVWRKIKKVLNY